MYPQHVWYAAVVGLEVLGMPGCEDGQHACDAELRYVECRTNCKLSPVA